MSRRAFTLIELLVVVAIIGTLIGLLLPAVQKVREAANRTRCSNNLKQLGIGLHLYHDATARLPNGVTWPTGIYGNPRVNFWFHLLPHIEQEALYQSVNVNVSGILWYGNNADPVSKPIVLLLCPSDSDAPAAKWGYAVSNYRGVFSGNQIGDIYTNTTVFGVNRGVRFTDVTDGTSNTMMLTEGPRGYPDEARGFAWSDQPAGGCVVFTGLGPNSPLPDRCYPYPGWCVDRPNQGLPATSGDGYRTDTAGARSRHSGGVYAAMCDGSVRFVSDVVPLATWRAVGTRAGGEVVTLD